MTRIAKLAGTSGLALVVSLLLPASSPIHAQTNTQTPTFTRDVLPVLQRSCQKCHRPDTAAPMSLLTYQEVRPWVRSIKARVSNRQMPPWHIDRSIGEYLDDPSLSDQEIATVVKWIDGGAPQGDPADAPPPLKFMPVDEWAFGEPDLVVEMKEGVVIPATGADFTPNEVVDPGIKEDRYVKWIQIIPTAHCCVHHSHVYASTPEGADREGLGLGMGSNTENEVDLIEYAAGNDADLFAEGTAKLIKAGSLFRFSRTIIPTARKRTIARRSGSSSIPKGTSRNMSSPPIESARASATTGP